MNTAMDQRTTDISSDTSQSDSQVSQDVKESRLKMASVLILTLFNLTYYMDRFGIAGTYRKNSLHYQFVSKSLA